jgi:hypothetical protein
LQTRLPEDYYAWHSRDVARASLSVDTYLSVVDFIMLDEEVASWIRLIGWVTHKDALRNRVVAIAQQTGS